MRVVRVERGSAADRAGLRANDELVAIGGKSVGDAVDVAFALGWADEDTTDFEFSRDSSRLVAALPPEPLGDLGIELAPDGVRTCGNRCVFCFVDQLPKGLRPSLYVKDEDYRLSFLFGNYVTLTNMGDDDFERIAEQRLSPLYVSVHASDDDVRRRMLGNAGAPPILGQLSRLANSGITVHTQVVIVPGMNDGAVLDRTIADLADLGRAVASVAVVPVGLTAHRDGLPEIEPVSPRGATEILDLIERHQAALTAARGESFVYAADELYLLAGRELPQLESYGDLPQLENGVGLLRSFEAALESRVAELDGKVTAPIRVAVVTSSLAGDFLERTAGPLLASVGPIETRFVRVENTLLGPTVTVAGLLPGRDIAAAVAAAASDELVLIPAEAFNDDGLTIDGMDLEEISAGSRCRRVMAAGDLVDAILDHVGKHDIKESRQ